MSRYRTVKEGNFPDRYLEGSVGIKDKYRLTGHQNFLPYLAYKAYNNSQMWHLIAEVNGIIDPLDIEDGVLLIPTEDLANKI